MSAQIDPQFEAAKFKYISNVMKVIDSGVGRPIDAAALEKMATAHARRSRRASLPGPNPFEQLTRETITPEETMAAIFFDVMKKHFAESFVRIYAEVFCQTLEAGNVNGLIECHAIAQDMNEDSIVSWVDAYEVVNDWRQQMALCGLTVPDNFVAPERRRKFKDDHLSKAAAMAGMTREDLKTALLSGKHHDAIVIYVQGDGVKPQALIETSPLFVQWDDDLASTEFFHINRVVEMSEDGIRNWVAKDVPA